MTTNRDGKGKQTARVADCQTAHVAICEMGTTTKRNGCEPVTQTAHEAGCGKHTMRHELPKSNSAQVVVTLPNGYGTMCKTVPSGSQPV